METSSISRLFIALIVIFSIVNQVKSDNITAESAAPCMTPTKTQGQCVPIQRCRNIYSIVSKPDPPSLGIANYITRAACTLPNVNRSICCQPEEVVIEQALDKQISRTENLTAENATPCMTPNKTQGQCVPIRRCQNIHNIVTSSKPPPAAIARYINLAACNLPNVIRSVCCQPKEVVKESALVKQISTQVSNVTAESATPCVTPTKMNGQCVPIERCRNIYNITSRADPPPVGIANYIKRAACTLPNVNRSVCCQLEEVIKEQALVKHVSRQGNETAESATPRTTPTKTPEKVTTEQTPLNSNHSNSNLLPEDCGLSISDRISKGNVTQVFSYPWMAVLQYDNGTHFVDGCGGTLINKRYVLTAAHCISSGMRVRLGEHTKNQDEDCNIYLNTRGEEEDRDCAPPPEDYEIESYVVHPDYDEQLYGNDIGLLRLKKDVVMNDNTKPICLPVTPELRTKQLEKFIVTGWGATESSPGSEILMEAILPRVDNVKCQRKYARSKVLISDKQLCAGGQHKVDACRGDSGGPLGFSANYDGRARFVQFGVVSFGVASCGSINVPGVYTRVSSYVDWILDNIKP